VGEDRTLVAVGDLLGGAKVVAGRENYPLRAVIVEPLDSLVGQQRVKRGGGAFDVMTAHLRPMVGMDRVPVKEAGEELLHALATTPAELRSVALLCKTGLLS
jgi:hypothetical protein